MGTVTGQGEDMGYYDEVMFGIWFSFKNHSECLIFLGGSNPFET